MGTVYAGSEDHLATVEVNAGPSFGPVVGSTWVLPGDPATVHVLARSGRVALVALPVPHVALASSLVARALLWAPGIKPGKRGRGMDGVPTISITQGQRVTLTAYLQDHAGAAITQSTVQSVTAAVYRPSIEGGEALKLWMPEVTDAIYSTTQTALDPDGYNLEVEFELDYSAEGLIQLEVVVELTSGERLTARGRVRVEAVLSLPINSY